MTNQQLSNQSFGPAAPAAGGAFPIRRLLFATADDRTATLVIRGGGSLSLDARIARGTAGPPGPAS